MPRRSPVLLLTALLPPLALLVAHAARYLPFVADDALISLRYARRLLDGAGLTWTDGERVEGYSNLLWILCTAALGAIGIDLVDALRLLGIACSAAAIAALVVRYRPTEIAQIPAALLPALALAAAGPIAIWAVGGLEQPLLVALLAWSLVWSLPLLEADDPRLVRRAGICLALLCLTRPDGPIFTAAIAAALVPGRGFSRAGWSIALRISLPSLAALLGQLAFRLVYYGDWVANTARVKVAFSLPRLVDGLHYVGDGLLAFSGLALLAVAGLAACVDPQRRRRLLVLLIPLIAWLSYVAAVGGDIFPGRRHLAPAVVLLAFIAAEGLAWAATRSRQLAGGAAAAGMLALPLLGWTQLRDPENHRAIHERWEWDGEVIGRLLGHAFSASDPLLAVDPAGCLPYFSGLRSLDLLGLNDRWLALHPPSTFGTGMLGHELGDGAYALSREPDLLVLCGPGGSESGCFRSGRELLADPRFSAEFATVHFEARDPRPFRSQIQVRREGRIGIRRTDASIEIPGFLFASKPKLVAHLDGAGRLGTALLENAVASYRIDLPAGSWTLAAEREGELRIGIWAGARQLASGASPLRFEHGGGPVDLRLRGQAHLRGVRLDATENGTDGGGLDPCGMLRRTSKPASREKPWQRSSSMERRSPPVCDPR